MNNSSENIHNSHIEASSLQSQSIWSSDGFPLHAKSQQGLLCVSWLSEMFCLSEDKTKNSACKVC